MRVPTGKFDSLSQAIGKVCKNDHHAKLQRRRLPQVKVFQKLIGELGNLGADEQLNTRRRAHTNMSLDTIAEMSPVRVPRAAEPKNILRK